MSVISFHHTNSARHRLPRLTVSQYTGPILIQETETWGVRLKPSFQKGLSNILQTRRVISEALERETGRLTGWQAAFCFPRRNLSPSQIRFADIFSAPLFSRCMFGWAGITSEASEDESWEWRRRGKRAALCHRWRRRMYLRTSCSAEEASNWICWRKTGVLS